MPHTRRVVQLVVLVLLTLAAWPTAAAYADSPILYVRPPAADCAGLSNCYTSIQSAIDAAPAEAEIRIAAGAYTEMLERDGQRQIAHITKSLTLRGGYNLDFTQWDPVARPTTLDAQYQGRAVYIAGAPFVVLEGLRLTRGAASALAQRGGGLYLADAGLHLLHCVLSQNIADAGPGLAEGSIAEGGGAYLLNPGPDTLIEGCRFSNNVVSNTSNSGHGGGLFINGGAAHLLNNQFRDNVGSQTSIGRGGGAFLRAGQYHLQGNEFADNVASRGTAGYGGGLFAGAAAQLVLEDNTFVGNRAAETGSGGGGGVNLTAGASAHLTNNTLRSNVASGGGYGGGGGLRADAGAVFTLTRNLFTNNIGSLGQEGYGGGFLAIQALGALSANLFEENIASAGGTGGGGGLRANFCALTLDGNRFLANIALLAPSTRDHGGGLWLESSVVTLTNNLMAENQAGGAGAGVYAFGVASTPVQLLLRHNTLADNLGDALAVGAYANVSAHNTLIAGNARGFRLLAPALSTLAASHTLFWDNPTAEQGSNPVFGEPFFLAGVPSYQLGPGSAAHDAGADVGVTSDLLGRARPVGPRPDIGAYESPAWVLLPLLRRQP